MNFSTLNSFTLICGVVGVILLIAHLLTGKKHNQLRVSGTFLIILTVISSFISRM